MSRDTSKNTPKGARGVPVLLVNNQKPLTESHGNKNIASQAPQTHAHPNTSANGKVAHKRNPDDPSPNKGLTIGSQLHTTQSKDYLDRYLRAHAAKHAEPSKFFWPHARLKRLLDRHRVHLALTSAECNEKGLISETVANEYCNYIVAPRGASSSSSSESYLRIFAILILQGQGGDIGNFIEAKLSDAHLPLDVESGALASKCFDLWNWRAHQKDLFRMGQQGVMVQYFDMEPGNKVKHFDIKQETLLPWLEPLLDKQHDIEERDGGFGTVKKYRIDPESHGFHNLLRKVELSSDLVAVKSLKRPQSKAQWDTFDQEVRMLKLFSGKAHRCLITLLATYAMNGHYHLIFPAARCDLGIFWERHPGPLVDPKNINEDRARWTSKQIHGLIDALRFIHSGHQDVSAQSLAPDPQRYGRHGDLKPENILWFESPLDDLGTLVITDLGISNIHRPESRSNVPNEGLPNSPSYRPPECDIQGGMISRSFDVWTMGCVLLEMTCWLLGGGVMRKKFEESRFSPYVTGAQVDIFFDICRITDNHIYGVKVKDSVFECIKSLHNSPGCTPFVHDLLDMIQKDMIVAWPTSSRRTAADLFRKVDRMYERAKVDRDYIVTPHPEERRMGPNGLIEVALSESLKGRLCTAKEAMAKLQGDL